MNKRVLYKIVDKDDLGSLSVNSRSKYHLTYEKGKIVKASEETLGIFCFKTRKNAEYYLLSDCKIIRVKPLGIVEKVKYICCDTSKLSSFYKLKNPIKSNLTIIDAFHLGSFVCDKVEVLE